LVFSQSGNKPDLNGLKDQILPLLQQYLGSKPQGRNNIDAILQQVTNAAATALPGLIISLLGKRDLNQFASLADKFQLSTILPQVASFLTPEKLQELQNKIFAIVLSAVGNNWSLPAITQAIQQLVTQFVPQITQMRIDWEGVGQAALQGVVTALPSILIGAISLFGKRDLSDEGRDLNQIFNLVNQFQLSTLIPQVEEYLGADKLQELQNQFFGTVVSALGNNWNLGTVSQLLQQLVTQYIPQIAFMRIDWEAIGQAALEGVASALPSILIGAISLFGKRDLSDEGRDLNQIFNLANQFQLNTLIPQIEEYLGADKLQELQNQFFGTVVSALGNNWNLGTVSQLLQQLVTQYIPQIAFMRIDWEAIGQAALEGVASALPSILIGAISLFGKRGLDLNVQQLLSQLPINQIAQIVQLVLNSDKTQVLSKLQQLLQQFFPHLRGTINFDELAANILNNLNNLLPIISQGIFSNIFG